MRWKVPTNKMFMVSQMSPISCQNTPIIYNYQLLHCLCIVSNYTTNHLVMRLCKMLQEANILVIIIAVQKGSTSPQGSGQTSSISIQIDGTCHHRLCFCWISSPADHYKVHHSCKCHWHTKIQHDIIIDLHIYLLLNDFCSFQETSSAWCKLDYLLYDISPLEQSQTVLFAPFKMVRLGSWDHGQCEKYTSFLGKDLTRIYCCFDLQSFTDDEGFFHIPTGCSNHFGVQFVI